LADCRSVPLCPVARCRQRRSALRYPDLEYNPVGKAGIAANVHVLCLLGRSRLQTASPAVCQPKRVLIRTSCLIGVHLDDDRIGLRHIRRSRLRHPYWMLALLQWRRHHEDNRQHEEHIDLSCPTVVSVRRNPEPEFGDSHRNPQNARERTCAMSRQAWGFR